MALSLNPTNAVNSVHDILGHTFSNNLLLMEALDTSGLRAPESNQRLAMLGDAVLKTVVLDDWYAAGTSKGRGNSLVSTLGSNANLSDVARRAGLEDHVVSNPGHVGRVSDKTLATTVEAVLGAVYLDSGKDIDVVRLATARLELTLQCFKTNSTSGLPNEPIYSH